MNWFHMRKCAIEKKAILGDHELAQQVLLDIDSLKNA